MRERSVRLIIAFFFVLLAYAVFNDLWIAHLAIHPYKVGDWQINYAGGFVRRGAWLRLRDGLELVGQRVP